MVGPAWFHRRRLAQTLATAAICTLAVACAGTRATPASGRSAVARVSTPSSNPVPAPSAATTPLTQPLLVPASIPVILYADPVDRTQVDGITWDGQASGKVGTSIPGLGLWPNPAGTMYATASDFRDRSGRVIAPLTTRTKGFFGTWADDGQHYCQMSPPDVPVGSAGQATTLLLAVPGAQPRSVAHVGMVHEQTSIRVAACSVEHDRAVVVQSGGQGVSTAQYWVVQLSTGRVLWTHHFTPSASTIEVTSSRDRQFVVENASSLPNGSQPATATVFGADGAAVAHLVGRLEALVDGTLAVTTPGYGRPPSLTRWRDDAVLWTAPAGTSFADATLQPQGRDAAIWVQNPAYPQNTGYPIRDVYVVNPDGQARRLLTRF